MINKKLIDAYNATSTDDGHGEIETVEAWLEKQLIWRIETIEAKDKEIQSLKSQIFALNRFRAEDAGSAISEANELREKIKEQELIMYGMEEGVGDWKTLCSDQQREIQSLTEENLQLRNAAEIAANMYGNLLNQKSEVHKQVESLTEQLQLMTGKYNGAKELLKQYNQNRV